MKKVFLSLGSNLGNKKSNIDNAINCIDKHFKIKKVSKYYETEPIGFKGQPNFVNVALEIEVENKPTEMYHSLRTIEISIGKEKQFRWGPRKIDIDILLYDKEIIENEELVIPHREMLNRRFVLEPLYEIAGDIDIPGEKHTLKHFLDNVKCQVISPIKN